MQLGDINPNIPVPVTSGHGTPISIAYPDNDWSRDAFLEVAGPATSGPIPSAFATKEEALAAAAGLSHGAQPALAVMFDPTTSSTRSSTPWYIQSLQIANPSATGFFDRAGNWRHTGYRVDTDFLNLETNPSKSFFAEFVKKAPYAAGVVAIVDGSVLIPATKFQH